MVEYIFHIGMGKTGTSSIQKSLNGNKQLLADKKIYYSGMLFSEIDEAYKTIIGTRDFLTQEPAENYAAHAKSYFEKTKAAAEHLGADVVLVSNETIAGSVAHSHSFFEALSKLAPTRFIVYLRNPYDWLPSAYAQWGLAHKVNKGPTRSFADLAGDLVHQYDSIIEWANRFPETLDVRNFSQNVVSDFYDGLGLDVEVEETRILKRPVTSELYLRALYNSRFDDEVLPTKFQREMIFNRRGKIDSLDHNFERFFSLEHTHDIVDSNLDVFDELKARFNLEVTKPTKKTHPPSELKAELRESLLDMMVDVNISQSIVIRQLSKRLEKLEAAYDEKLDNKA